MRKRILQVFGMVSLTIVFSLFAPLTMATAGWTRTYPGEDMDILTPVSLIQTLDGGYATVSFAYLRRYSSGGGPFTSSYELQILKTDSNGGVQWKRSFPNYYSEQCSIVQTADEGYVVAGGAFWLFKINSQGSVLWSKTYQLNDESSSPSQVYSMIQARDGGFALAGTVETMDGSKDFWLVKTNPEGVPQWNQTYNSGTYTDSSGYVNPREDIARSVVQTSDGGYALVGSATLWRASTSSVVYSSWVVKTDAQGKQLWNKGFDLLNSPGYDCLIVQTSDGGYAVAGTQNGDFCLFKINSANQLQWSKTYGDSEDDSPCSLVQLEDGGYAMAGTWNPTNATSLIRPTMGLLRTDSAGQLLWGRTYRAKENATAFSTEQAGAMIRTSDGGYGLVGNTQFGGEPHVDVFFVKTETLEQPPKITPLPNPDGSEPSTPETPQTPNQNQSNTTNSTTPGDDKTKPAANAGPDRAVKLGAQVTFDGSASSSNLSIVSYSWTFMDVTAKTLSGVSPSYMFSAPGTYLVTLSVKDAAGNEATDTVVVTVSEETGEIPSPLIVAAVAGVAVVAVVAFLVFRTRKFHGKKMN